MLTDAERSALSNMYEEGKSFEFIANALGKPQAEVIKEYNLIRDEKSAGKRQYQDRPNNNNNNNNNNRRGNNRRKGNGSRQDRDVPFGHFVDFDEDGPFPTGRGGGGRGGGRGRGGRGGGTSNVFYDIDEEMMGRMMDEEVGGPPPPGMSYFFDPVTGEVFADADPEMMGEDGEYFVPGDEDFFEFEEGVGEGLFGHADRPPRRGGGRGGGGGGGRGRSNGNGGSRKFNHYMHRGGGGGGGQHRRGGGGGGRGGGRGDYRGKS